MEGLPEILGFGEWTTPCLVLPTWPSPYQHLMDHRQSTGQHLSKAHCQPWTTGPQITPLPPHRPQLPLPQKSPALAPWNPTLGLGLHSCSFSRSQEGAEGLPISSEKEVGLGLSGQG